MTERYTYLNVSIQSLSENFEQPLSYTETRDASFLYAKSSSQVSLIRFNIDCHLPIWIPIIERNQADPDRSVYEITMTFGGIDYNDYAEWTPQFNLSAPAMLSSGFQDNSGKYYWAMDVEHILSILNTTLSDVSTLVNVGVPGTLTAPFPYFSYSSGFVFNAGTANNSTILNNGTLQVYFNHQLYNLLSGFPFVSINQLNLTNYALLRITATGTTSNSVALSDDIINFSPVNKIIVSSNLSIRAELTEPNYPYGYIVNTSSYPSLNLSQQSILTDFIFNNTSPNSHVIIEYDPQEFRWLSTLRGVQSGTETFRLDCYWQDFYGNLYMINLQYHNTATFKLAFRTYE